MAKQSFSFILDKMCKKLAGWKAKSLSFAGKVTLAQASLLNIPGYVFQTSLIPASMCEEAEKLCRDFMWGSTANTRRCHLIAWDSLCKPKDEGGLGFHNLRTLNKAHMMKLVWSMISNPDKLWVRIMKAKYSCGVQAMPRFVHNANSASTWKAMVSAWGDVNCNLIWVVRNGRGIRFWRDSWIPGVGVLADFLASSIPVGEIEFPVSHYSRNGHWDWEKIQCVVPSEICDRLAALRPPSAGQSDFPCWSLTSTGDFSLKTAYSFLARPHEELEDLNPLFNKVWRWQGPNPNRAFLMICVLVVIEAQRPSCIRFGIAMILGNFGIILLLRSIGASFLVLASTIGWTGTCLLMILAVTIRIGRFSLGSLCVVFGRIEIPLFSLNLPTLEVPCIFNSLIKQILLFCRL